MSETGWLVEWEGRWARLCTGKRKRLEWTADAFRALRLSREQDAESLMGWLASVEHYSPSLIVSEHVFD